MSILLRNMKRAGDPIEHPKNPKRRLIATLSIPADDKTTLEKRVSNLESESQGFVLLHESNDMDITYQEEKLKELKKKTGRAFRHVKQSIAEKIGELRDDLIERLESHIIHSRQRSIGNRTTLAVLKEGLNLVEKQTAINADKMVMIETWHELNDDSLTRVLLEKLEKRVDDLASSHETDDMLNDTHHTLSDARLHRLEKLVLSNTTIQNRMKTMEEKWELFETWMKENNKSFI